MIESFFDDARIQKLIDFGNASEVHSNETFCPTAAPTNWFWIITIGGTVFGKNEKRQNDSMQLQTESNGMMRKKKLNVQ